MHKKDKYILLADDDQDDRFFFNEALKGLQIKTSLTTVGNGEELIKWLTSRTQQLPDIIFLDLNMPRKNGSECLVEIKANALIRHIPVIIYSTALYDGIADLLYKNGAHYYLKKCEFSLLTNGIQEVLTSLEENPDQPAWDNFILHCSETKSNRTHPDLKGDWQK